MKKSNPPQASPFALFAFIAFLLIILIRALPYIFPAIILFLCVLLFIDIFSAVKFYNRKRLIKELGGSGCYFEDLSNKISRKEPVVFSSNEIFNQLYTFYAETLLSRDVKYKEGNLKIDSTGKVLFDKYNIVYKKSPITVRFILRKRRGVVFYIFPNAILAFAEGPFKKAFIGAYSLNLLNISYTRSIHPCNVVVDERTKNPIEYYYKYNPVPDSDIHYCDWTVKNLDGSRSFKGGLLPEHNPLIFELKYAQIKYEFGSMNAVVIYSNHSAAKQFVEGYLTYTTSNKTQK